VGSLTNIGDLGFEVEQGSRLHRRAGPGQRPQPLSSPTGLRNPVGLAWQPDSGVLWTVVNERDGLGDETPPDYLTSVRDGGFYGWPYCYWGRTVDDRVQPQDPARVAQAITPGLRARRAHRVARPVLDAARNAARLRRGRHGRSASTVHGTAAPSAATGSSSCRSRTAARAGSRHATS
jgi:hypothetical protein